MSSAQYERLREVFEGACALPAGERAAYLDDACRDDQELRRKVDELLAHDDRPIAFVDQAIVGGGAAVLARGLEDLDAPPPERVGRYRILGIIGEGGMGVVYEAEQDDPKRRVALKIVRPGVVTRDLLRRFQHETHVLGQLRHPGIAQIYEAGTADHGDGDRPFFAMELVRGDALLASAHARELGVADRLELFAKVCDAVHYAHGKGVIHRDLKPENILVETQSGQPRILDFGVARATDADLQIVSTHTGVGQLVGTVPYMSPEQAAGDPRQLDARSDIYALGVILFELLAGRLPYLVQGKMMHEALRIIQHDEPSRLSSVSRVYRGDIETIVAKALEKDKARRYQSAGELAADLRRHLDNRPIVARPPSALYQLRKFTRRHKGVVTAVAALIVVLVMATAVSATLALRESRQRQRADRGAREAEQVAEFQASQIGAIDVELMANRLRADMISEVRTGLAREGLDPDEVTERAERLTELLASANFTNVALRTLDRNIFDGALKAVAEQFADQELVKARLLQTIADTQRDLGLLEEATEPQVEALEIRRRVLGDEHEDTLKSLNRTGYLLQNQGKVVEAERYYRQALEGRRRVLGNDHPHTLDSLNNMGFLLRARGKLAEAEPYYIETLEGSRRVLGNDHPDTLSSVGNMASLLRAQGKLEEAERYYREALDGRRRVLGNDHPHTLISIDGMGTLLQSRGKLAEAEPYYREALAARRRVSGDTHRDTLVTMNNLGVLLQRMGKLDEAEAYLREALESRRRALGPQHPDTVVAIGSLGSLLYSQGKLAEAEPYYLQALEGRRRVFGDEHPRTLAAISSMGTLLQGQGRLEDAEQHYREALEHRRRLLGAEHPDTLASENEVGNLLRIRGRLSEAEPYLRAALDGRRRVLGDEHPYTLSSISLMGLLMQDDGRLAEAEAHLREVYETCRRTRGEAHEQTLVSGTNLADVLNLAERCDESEALARGLVETGTAALGAGHWRVAEARSALGAALAGQGRYDEAEPELLAGHAGLDAALPDAARLRALTKAIERLVRLYEAWNRPEPADAWRALLEREG